MSERILVVEDHPDLREFCADVLKRAGYEVIEAGSARAAEGIIRSSTIDLLVTDLKIPGADGLHVVKVGKDADPEMIVILITGFPTVETAVEAMKRGASEYLIKPFTEEQLSAVVGAALEKRKTKEAYRLLTTQLRTSFTLNGIVGRSPAMLRLFDDIRSAAGVDANVLILGESGVGKERVARTTHENSRRRNKPFTAINCAAIPDNLLEAELFGYERGAFTGAHNAKEGLLESTDGGTLFLDELCELNPLLQAKLLRALEEGAVRRVGGRHPVPFDVRFIASTNRDIRDEIRRQRFREDLFFRVNVIEIRVPPLMDRRNDIPLLTAHFLEMSTARREPRIEGISHEAMELLVKYDWPGNVRELKNAVERALAYARGLFLTPEDFPETVMRGAESRGGSAFRTWKERTFERLQGDFVRKALQQHGGNVSRAAKTLGVHRSTLQRFMKRYRVPAA